MGFIFLLHHQFCSHWQAGQDTTGRQVAQQHLQGLPEGVAGDGGAPGDGHDHDDDNDGDDVDYCLPDYYVYILTVGSN